MKVTVVQDQGVTVLEPKGKITIGVGDVMLRGAVLEALEAGSRRLIIDLRDVKTIDSSGVGELVSAYTTVTNRGGLLKLCNLPAKVADVLQVTQLITVFDIYETREEAISSFEEG